MTKGGFLCLPTPQRSCPLPVPETVKPPQMMKGVLGLGEVL